jgi:hypothetical protein
VRPATLAAIVGAGIVVCALAACGGRKAEITSTEYRSVTAGTGSARVIDLLGEPEAKRETPDGGFAFGYRMPTVIEDKQGERHRDTYVCVFFFDSHSKLERKTCVLPKDVKT